MSDENSLIPFYFSVMIVLFLGAMLGITFSSFTNKVGSTYHGVVVQEMCNQGSTSYVLIEISNQTSRTRNYRVEYMTCLDFLFHHQKGVTITDDAWFNGIAVYRWD